MSKAGAWVSQQQIASLTIDTNTITTAQVWPGHIVPGQSATRVVSFINNATDNVNSSMFTVTVPNVNCAASVTIMFGGGYSDGDGCDVKLYTLAISKITGTICVATLSTASTVGNNASTGHTSMTVTGVIGTIAGAGNANTFAIRAKVAAGSAAVGGAVHPLWGSAEMFSGQGTVGITAT